MPQGLSSSTDSLWVKSALLWPRQFLREPIPLYLNSLQKGAMFGRNTRKFSQTWSNSFKPGAPAALGDGLWGHLLFLFRPLQSPAWVILLLCTRGNTHTQNFSSTLWRVQVFKIITEKYSILLVICLCGYKVVITILSKCEIMKILGVSVWNLKDYIF